MMWICWNLAIVGIGNLPWHYMDRLPTWPFWLPTKNPLKSSLKVKTKVCHLKTFDNIDRHQINIMSQDCRGGVISDTIW